jgi:hypothetical protein
MRNIEWNVSSNADKLVAVLLAVTVLIALV